MPNLLGTEVRDTVTGFEGVVTSHTEWLYGEDGYGVTAKSLGKDGSPVSFNFHLNRLESLSAVGEAQTDEETPAPPA